jgi:hypothetical protein
MVPAPPIAPAIVDTDLACVGCDYNLRTQPTDGVCPECGKRIRDTIRFPHLARAAPRWLTSLVDSVTVLLVAVGFGVACLVLGDRRDRLVPMGLAVSAWALGWFAVWLLTRPEPGVRNRPARVRGWVLRVLATGPYVGVFGGPALVASLGPWAFLVMALLMALVAPATFLYYDHLARAARRLPNAALGVQAQVLSYLMPPAMLVSIARVMMYGRGPQSATEALLLLPMTALPGVGDAWTFATIVSARVQLLHILPLTAGMSAVLLLAAMAVLVQFRLAFAAAVDAARQERQERHDAKDAKKDRGAME